MRQGLIIGARPGFTRGKPFPRVPLGRGSWKITSENLVSSKIQIIVFTKVQAEHGIVDHPKIIQFNGNGNVPLVQGPAEICAEILESGQESYISIYATRM